MLHLNPKSIYAESCILKLTKNQKGKPKNDKFSKALCLFRRGASFFCLI